ncbi:hypothetical protein ACF0H2_07695 [Serratia marcescens]
MLRNRDLDRRPNRAAPQQLRRGALHRTARRYRSFGAGARDPSGLAEADTVQARFFEAQDGQPVQRLPLIADPARVQAPEWFDFSARPDASSAALA